MKQCMNSDELHKRINKIKGQISAIERMIDEEVPCEEIMIQINATKGALHGVGLTILKGHMTHCVKDCIKNGDDSYLENLTKVLEQFSKI